LDDNNFIRFSNERLDPRQGEPWFFPDEAKVSMDTAQRPDAKPFDIIIVGSGTFGAALASALYERDSLVIQ